MSHVKVDSDPAPLCSTVDTCTATARVCYWKYFAHFLREDRDSDPDSRPSPLTLFGECARWMLQLLWFLVELGS